LYHCFSVGVDIIISYFTPNVLKWLKEDKTKYEDDLIRKLKILEKSEEEDKESD